MQRATFAISTPNLFLPIFAFLADCKSHDHLTFTLCLRNISNKSIEFFELQELFLLSTLEGKPLSFVRNHNVFVIQ